MERWVDLGTLDPRGVGSGPALTTRLPIPGTRTLVQLYGRSFASCIIERRRLCVAHGSSTHRQRMVPGQRRHRMLRACRHTRPCWRTW